MKNFIKYLIFIIVSTPVHAVLTSISGQSIPGSVALVSPGSVRLIWQIKSTLAYTQVHSDQIGFALSSCNSAELTLIRPLNGKTNEQGTVRLQEVVPIPPALTIRARKEGHTSLLLCRIFSDANSSYVASVTLPLRTSGLSGKTLGLTQISLRLDNGDIFAIVPRYSPLKAHARVRYQGQGVLEGQWEIAVPPVNMTHPLWRPVGQIHQRLIAGGKVLLESPALPTRIPGLYLLRLKLTRPPLQADALILRYQVLGQQDDVSGRTPITLLGPENNAQLSSNMRFGWRCLKQADHYLLMMQAVEDDKIYGQAVPSRCRHGQMFIRPSTALWANTRPGQHYRWWVEGFDISGRMTGVSPVREGRTLP